MTKGSKSSEVAEQSTSQLATMMGQCQVPHPHHEKMQSHPEVQGCALTSWCSVFLA